MATGTLPTLLNGQPIALADVPVLGISAFRETVIERADVVTRIAALFGDRRDGDQVRLYAVLTNGAEGTLTVLATDLDGDEYPAITPDCPQAHWFEREIAEQWGVKPLGHPWLKPIRFHSSYRPGHDAWSRTVGEAILPSVTDFY